MFQKESSRKNLKITIAINTKIRDEKLQQDIKKEAAKISPMSSGKIDKYECLTGKEILPDQIRIIEQVSFTYLLQTKLQKNKQK